MVNWESSLPVPSIDPGLCNGCGLCVQICPNKVLLLKESIAVVVKPDACIYIGHCENICPTHAISRLFQIVFIHEEEKQMQSTFYPDWHEKAVFSSEGPKPQVLAENEKLKVIIGSLEPGQKIPPHPEAQAVYHFLEGNGWMTVDGERYSVHTGATVITAQGVARGVEADTRLVFLAVRIA